MRHTKSKRGATTIKLNLEKAYDRLKWSFIEETLCDAGIPTKLLGVIMKIVSSGSCRLLRNGEVTESIKTNRGLRQGDPLSPNLLVLYIERLGQWYMNKVAKGRLKAMKASSQGSKLNHMFFANDLLVFAEADPDQLRCIKEGLDLLCWCSGQ